MRHPFQRFLLAALCLALGAHLASSMYVSEIRRSVLRADPELTAWVRSVADSRGKEICDEVTPDPTILVRSTGDYGCPIELYRWCFDHVVPLAHFGNYMGDNYTVAQHGTTYTGDDGNGLVVNFFETYRDDKTIVYSGRGTLEIMGIGSSGSFVNVLEFEPLNDRTIRTRSTIYVRVDSGFKRFVARVVFAVSDLENTIKEKLFELDGTVVAVLKQFLDDPELPGVLAAPPTAAEVAAREALEARALTEKGRSKPSKHGGRRGRRRKDEATAPGDETGMPAHKSPDGEEELVLSTLETAGYWRDTLSPEALQEMVAILERWNSAGSAANAAESAPASSHH